MAELDRYDVEVVRAKQPGTGHELTVPADWAEEQGFQVLDKPAVDAGGDRLPTKYNTSISDAAAAKGETEKSYDTWLKADLVAEIEKRNAERPDDAQLSTEGTNADKAKVLEDDDESSASAETDETQED